jgi:hypothetical protein
MTIGQKYVVKFHEDGTGTPVADSVDFSGSFSYSGSYTSNVVVQKDDISGTVNDRFIVTYYWANGAGPNLGTVTVAALLADAVAQVNTVLPDEAGP